ncbi:NUDIX domain-containing protein [Rummeliibacillus sp. NPDC094406]|uniref:NUDIX hydrolase n=1 Tax=Rummeliibacillus sp. NPDC094406 TaxID=3364511 RepID=UPI0037F4DBC4
MVRGENEDELWDIYDKDRRVTGRLHRRGDKLLEGDYHLVVHVCVFNSNNQLLIQQRQPWKKGWPNMWDLTVGGSALAGDDSVTAAERETKEELGLELDLSKERPRFTINFPEGFDDYYIITQDVNIEELDLQEDEVQAVKWVDKVELLHMVENGEMIPYYFLDIIFELKDIWGSRISDVRK